MKKMAKVVATATVGIFAAIGVACTAIIVAGLVQELKEEEKLYKPFES